VSGRPGCIGSGLEETGESKRSVRRHGGVLLDVNPETLRKWVEERERVESGGSPAPRSAEAEWSGRCAVGSRS
jgi:hypothetical protein